MTHKYNISGMTCNGCVEKVKSELLKMGDVIEADVHLATPQATIVMQKHIPVGELQRSLSKAGNYSISEADNGMHHYTAIQTQVITHQTPAGKIWFNTYKPILLIGVYITGITFLLEVINGDFSAHRWMQNFMAGFFLIFSFFKLLDLKGFAESYATYDVIAKKWFAWGYIYAFIELLLGVGFLAGYNPVLVNGVTFLVMSVSIIGVLQSVLNKRQIQCACLGAVFNLPMSTVTIIEDALMIVMSGVMLFMLLS